jgi:hypothetical protein
MYKEKEWLVKVFQQSKYHVGSKNLKIVDDFFNLSYFEQLLSHTFSCFLNTIPLTISMYREVDNDCYLLKSIPDRTIFKL